MLPNARFLGYDVYRVSLSPPKVECARQFIVDSPRGMTDISRHNGHLWAWFLDNDTHYWLQWKRGTPKYLYGVWHPCNYFKTTTNDGQIEKFYGRWYDQVAALVVLEPLFCDLIRWRVCGFL